MQVNKIFSNKRSTKVKKKIVILTSYFMMFQLILIGSEKHDTVFLFIEQKLTNACDALNFKKLLPSIIRVKKLGNLNVKV